MLNPVNTKHMDNSIFQALHLELRDTTRARSNKNHDDGEDASNNIDSKTLITAE